MAFSNRGENKDAYDLFYVLHYYGDSIEDIGKRILPIINEEQTKEALDIIKRDFTIHDGIGPIRVAKFINHEADDEIQADVVGDVEEFLKMCDKIGIKDEKH